MALQRSLKEPLFLGIDLGTSACKVSVVNKKGRIIAHANERYPLYILEGGGAEQNPKEWWEAIVKAVGFMRTFTFQPKLFMFSIIS